MITKHPRHSPHGYGVLSLEDVPFMENILRIIAGQFHRVNMLEIGVANGGTTIGIYNFCERNKIPFTWVGLDMEIGAPAFDLTGWGKFIEGDCHSSDVIGKVSFHVMDHGPFNLLFVDGCHCRECCRMDFQIYSPLVDKGGVVLFHDTCSHPEWQNHHIQCKPDRFIGTRAAIMDLGLIPNQHLPMNPQYQFIGEQNAGSTQGMMAFRKV